MISHHASSFPIMPCVLLSYLVFSHQAMCFPIRPCHSSKRNSSYLLLHYPSLYTFYTHFMFQGQNLFMGWWLWATYSFRLTLLKHYSNINQIISIVLKGITIWNSIFICTVNQLKNWDKGICSFQPLPLYHAGYEATVTCAFLEIHNGIKFLWVKKKIVTCFCW